MSSTHIQSPFQTNFEQIVHLNFISKYLNLNASEALKIRIEKGGETTCRGNIFNSIVIISQEQNQIILSEQKRR